MSILLETLNKTMEQHTILTKEIFDQAVREEYRQMRKVMGKREYRDYYLENRKSFISWEQLRTEPQKYGLEKIINYKTVKSTKYSALDVLNMIKQGMTVEDIEPMLYTQIKYITFKKVSEVK